MSKNKYLYLQDVLAWFSLAFSPWLFLVFVCISPFPSIVIFFTYSIISRNEIPYFIIMGIPFLILFFTIQYIYIYLLCLNSNSKVYLLFISIVFFVFLAWFSDFNIVGSLMMIAVFLYNHLLRLIYK